ncbi:MAG: hypothetical protein V1792_16805, partial [Pseudomonadota bacterium]
IFVAASVAMPYGSVLVQAVLQGNFIVHVGILGRTAGAIVRSDPPLDCARPCPAIPKYPGSWEEYAWPGGC